MLLCAPLSVAVHAVVRLTEGVGPLWILSSVTCGASVGCLRHPGSAAIPVSDFESESRSISCLGLLLIGFCWVLRLLISLLSNLCTDSSLTQGTFANNISF